MTKRFSRRRWLQGFSKLAATVATGGVLGCSGESGEPGQAQSEKPAANLRGDAPPVVILGFDGVDPRWVREWSAAGHLPNLKKLAEQGGLHDLKTTAPPQSPVAWSTFATGYGPGDHSIFDLILRKPPNPIPMPSGGTLVKPQLNPDGSLKKAASWKGGRSGQSFWSRLDEAGLETTALTIPYDFPLRPLKNGVELSGLGTPDVRGVNSYFQYFATDIAKGSDVPGGKKIPLVLDSDTAVAALEGPPDPSGKIGAKIALPVEFVCDAAAKTLRIQIDGQSQTVAAGHWSDWFRLSYPLSDKVAVKAICKFYVKSIAPELRIYVGPQNMDPYEPMLPLDTPNNFAGGLAEKHGLFKTVGWIHDTNALRADAIDEDTFLQDAYAGMDMRREILLDRLKNNPSPLFLAAFTGTDRISHMFYRYIDPEHPGYDAENAPKYEQAILDVYRHMDETVGEVVKRLQPGTRLLLLSDHGFHSYRHSFAVNTWLVEKGYMVLQGQKDASDLDSARAKMGKIRFLQGVDWSRTRAYGLGLGQIYINLRGRERQGAVNPGPEYDALVKEIREALLQEIDPQSGGKIISRMATRDEVFTGRFHRIAPDLQIGYSPGYQTEKSCLFGGVPRKVLTPNLDKWSGDHASSDWEQTPGFLMANFKIKEASPSILDFAPTVLRHFGLEPVEEMKGKAWDIES